MPEFRVKVHLTKTHEAEFVVSAEDEDGVEDAVDKALAEDALAKRPVINWELFNDSFEVIEASEV